LDRWLCPVGEHESGSSAAVGITIGYGTNISSSIASATSA